ncbi:MAG: MoaD/ThiS family protein [Anaerolineae bacterium]|nr:MoaD/ThiS family protein [Anaerolineae bacterium]
MRVAVTLYGELKRYVKSGAASVDVAEGTTVAQLLDSLGVDRRHPRLTAVNDDVVDEAHVLADGDHLEVMHAVAGG